MKKLYIAISAALLLAACAGNKNILNDKMAKYPADKYITKIAAAKEKEEAKAAALKDLKALFNNLDNYEDSAVRRESILSKAYTAQWWKDKASGKYYAIAVLERGPAMTTLKPFYTSIDGRLSSLAQRIQSEQDKYVRLKDAALMPPLFAQREQLDSEYRLLSFNASAFDEDKLYAWKAAYNKAFYDIKFNAKITGADDSAVKTYIIDALNSMGFYIGEGIENPDIELTINTVADKYPSKTTDGLFWCSSTATVALKDMATKGIFATFTETERIGSARAEEAQRRSLIAVGVKSVPVIKLKMIEYVNKK